jgi:hypothetical protein
MPKTANRPKQGERLTWCPKSCEGCNHPFNNSWESDYSMSGELVWICPKCEHTNYPALR